MAKSLPEIFISYSRKDRDLVVAFRALLQAQNILTWLDEHGIDVGDDWRADIEKAIQDCSVLLLLLSRNTTESRVVPKEVQYALSRGKTILPIYLEEPSAVEPPAGIGLELAGAHRNQWTLGQPLPEQLLKTLAEKHDIRTQAYHAQVNRASTGDRELEEQLRIAPKLLDRHAQRDHLETFVRQRAAKGSHVWTTGQPFLLVLHGPDNQCLDEFREALTGTRFEEWRRAGILPVTFRAAEEPVFLTSFLGWKMEQALGDALENGGRTDPASLATILKSRPGHGYSLTIQTSVKEKKEQDAVKLARSLAEYWRKFPATGGASLLVIFQVAYPFHTKGFAQDLEAAFRANHACVLPVLDDTDKAEARKWAMEPAIRPLLARLRLEADDARHLIDGIYATRGRSALPMEDLAAETRTALRKSRELNLPHHPS
jgi:hypothetical protein